MTYPIERKIRDAKIRAAVRLVAGVDNPLHYAEFFMQRPYEPRPEGEGGAEYMEAKKYAILVGATEFLADILIELDNNLRET